MNENIKFKGFSTYAQSVLEIKKFYKKNFSLRKRKGRKKHQSKIFS